MDDLTRTVRDIQDDVKERARDLDGHDPADDLGNAGDRLREGLGDAGDRLREGLGDAGDRLREGLDRAGDDERRQTERDLDRDPATRGA